MRPQVIDVNDMEIRDVGWQQRERPDRRRRRSRSRNRPRSTLVDLVVRRTYQCGSCCSRCLAVRFRTSFTYLSLSLSQKRRWSRPFVGPIWRRRSVKATSSCAGLSLRHRTLEPIGSGNKNEEADKKKRKPFCDYWHDLVAMKSPTRLLSMTDITKDTLIFGNELSVQLLLK